MICENVSVRADGQLLFAKQNTAALAATYGTPLYLMDEDRIRERCRTYLSAVKTAFDGKGCVLYASKAASFKHIYTIMNEEGMCIDVVSPGEIATALRAGFPMERVYYHSGHKSDDDIAYALSAGVGCFIVDTIEELLALERLTAAANRRQRIVLRLTPGIDPHTYEAVATGKVDSKFGFAIETGAADEAVQAALAQPHLQLEGFHCHVGSQVFDSDVFLRSAEIMLDYMYSVRERFGYTAAFLDLGGGYGVRYREDDATLDIAENIAQVGAYVKEKAAALRYPMPKIAFEPGRSIVADAGMTLYTVSSFKKIAGYKNYVMVDGGMTDNPRFALYGAPYTVVAASKMHEPCTVDCTVAGRCCESGDIIQEHVQMPASIKRGDLVACLTTGAYNYSMASNYNRVPRPPVVMLKGGESFVAVRRETLDDIVALDR